MPADYQLTYACLPTGITLYHVDSVAITGLTVQGFQVDGINALNSARDVRLSTVAAATTAATASPWAGRRRWPSTPAWRAATARPGCSPRLLGNARLPEPPARRHGAGLGRSGRPRLLRRQARARRARNRPDGPAPAAASQGDRGPTSRRHEQQAFGDRPAHGNPPGRRRPGGRRADDRGPQAGRGALPGEPGARRRGGDAVPSPRGPLRPRPAGPTSILLDLQLPKKDGREVLAEIRHDKQLRRIPVVVLTSSETQWEVLKGENLFVESYLIKPLGPGALQHRGQVAAEVPAGRRDRAAVSTRPPVSRTGFAKRHKDCGNGSCQRPPAATTRKTRRRGHRETHQGGAGLGREFFPRPVHTRRLSEGARHDEKSLHPRGRANRPAGVSRGRGRRNAAADHLRPRLSRRSAGRLPGLVVHAPGHDAHVRRSPEERHRGDGVEERPAAGGNPQRDRHVRLVGGDGLVAPGGSFTISSTGTPRPIATWCWNRRSFPAATRAAGCCTTCSTPATARTRPGTSS